MITAKFNAFFIPHYIHSAITVKIVGSERVLKASNKIQHVVSYDYYDMPKKDAQPRKNATPRV